MWLILAILALIAAFVLVRTILFKPDKITVEEKIPVEFDKDAAVASLQELVRCKTVSYRDASLEDNEEFEKFIALLPALYPNVFKT